MGGGYQVNVLCTLRNQIFEHLPQRSRIYGHSHGISTDGPVLTVSAAQGAAAEKHGTAAAVARQGRFLPGVNHGLGYQRSAGAAAVSGFPCQTVDTALPGAEFAVNIIHVIPSSNCWYFTIVQGDVQVNSLRTVKTVIK